MSSSSFSNPSQLLSLVHWKLVAIIVSTYILIITLWWSISSSSSDNSSSSNNNDDIHKRPMTSNFDELMAILRNEKQNQNHHKNHHLFKTATKTTQQRGVAIHQFAKELWRDWYYSGDKSSSLVLLPSSFLHHSLDTLILLNLKEEATEVFETILPSHHHRRRLQQQQNQNTNNKTESMQHTPNYLFTTSKNSQRKMMMMKTSDVLVKFVGGLIGAYSLTREERLLDRAIYYYTSIIKNSFESDGRDDEEEQQHGIPKRFLEPIAGFESPSYDENHHRHHDQDDKHQRHENHDDESDDKNKMSISEILSSFFPVDFLLASSSSSGGTKRQRFIRWLTNDVRILRKNAVVGADRQQETENDYDHDDSENRNMHLHHYLDESFLNVVANDGQDDFLEMLATSGILPCFIDSTKTKTKPTTKRFSGSVSLTNKFGRYQIESHLKHWILESRMLMMKNNEQHHQDISSQLYEDAIDGMFKFLARYTSTSSSSSKTYFAKLGEISVSDFVVLSSSSSSSSTFENNHETCRIPGILSLGLSFGVHHHNRRRMQQRQHLMNNNKSNSYYSSSSSGTESSAPLRYAWNETDVEKFASDLLTSCVNDISLSLSMMNNDDKNKNNIFLNNNNKALIGRTFGTIESLFYFHRYTRDHGLRELAWMLFEEVIVPWSRHRQQTRKQTQTRKENRVNSRNIDIDLEEEVLMSQTLKFLFLTFSGENVVGYDEFVFDFNGHPFRIPKK